MLMESLTAASLSEEVKIFLLLLVCDITVLFALEFTNRRLGARHQLLTRLEKVYRKG